MFFLSAFDPRASAAGDPDDGAALRRGLGGGGGLAAVAGIELGGGGLVAGTGALTRHGLKIITYKNSVQSCALLLLHTYRNWTTIVTCIINKQEWV